MAKDPKKKSKTEAKPSRKRANPLIDLEPTLYESADQVIDQLVRAGLGDTGEIALYRRALSDPRHAVNDARLREVAGVSLDRLVRLIVEDVNLFNRVRTLLQTRSRFVHEGEDPNVAAMRLRLESSEVSKRIVRKRHPRRVAET